MLLSVLKKEEDFDIIMESKCLVSQAFYMSGAMVFGMLGESI
jgi:hypothetical protein